MPRLGSFYILGGAIYYNFLGEGIGHSKLWQLIVPKVFSLLEYENKRELMNAPYGADRGRVAWTGKISQKGKPEGMGEYVLYGTKGCESFESRLREIFELGEDVMADFKTDPHYKLQGQDKEIFEQAMRMIKGKVEFKDSIFGESEEQKRRLKKMSS